MTKLENLENEAYGNNVGIINYDFNSNRIKGLYCDGTVALSKSLSGRERICVLTEELGHYYTTTGDIICQSSVANRKQERRARVWAYEKLVGLMGIVRCHQNGCSTLYDMAEFLEVTEKFLSEALQYYKDRHGVCATVDNYVIYFEPSLGVLELI